jgi:6-phosphofructokinase 1
MIEGDIRPMGPADVSNIIQRGGTILKTARSKEFRTAEGRARAYNELQRHSIQALVAIGGDGTYTGAKAMLEQFPDLRIVGCPGTIDNDLFGTDYTIGFDTAINTAVRAIDQLRDTADATNRLFFVEVMGRDAGYIALYTGIASGSEAVLVPETKTDIDALIRTLEYGWRRKKSSSIVVVAEGDEEGGAFEIAEKVKAKFQHYDYRVCVLGHVQRGGSPTVLDRVIASQMGAGAVDALLQGRSGVALGVVHNQLSYTPFEQALKVQGELNPSLLRLIEVLAV